MLTALLEGALDCIRGRDRCQFLEAREWFASERRDWPFSFLNICDFLEIDATALRKHLVGGKMDKANHHMEETAHGH